MLYVLKNNLNRQALLACLFLTGCLQSNAVVNTKQPGWINGESDLYPNSHYVVANGSASNAEQAKDRALANLTKVFELHIRESSTSRQDVKSLKQGGSEKVSTSQSLSSRIDIKTTKIIDGARIAEQWQHPGDLTHYALAVLDRKQAGNNIRGEIERLDQETGFELNAAKTENSPLIKVTNYQQALALQEKRDAMQRTLKVIDLSGQGSESKWNRAELRTLLDTSLSSLNMKPEIMSDSVGGLDKLLKGAMANAGFAEASKTKSNYILSASLETQPAIKNQDWFWLRGTLTLRLASADGTVQGNKTWPLKVSASSEAQLPARMMSSVEKKLNASLKSVVLGFAATE